MSVVFFPFLYSTKSLQIEYRFENLFKQEDIIESEQPNLSWDFKPDSHSVAIYVFFGRKKKKILFSEFPLKKV